MSIPSPTKPTKRVHVPPTAPDSTACLKPGISIPRHSKVSGSTMITVPLWKIAIPSRGSPQRDVEVVVFASVLDRESQTLHRTY